MACLTHDSEWGFSGTVLREDPLSHPFQWLRPDMVPPSLFLQCKPHLAPGGSGVLANPARIDEEFRKAWLPYFLSLWVKGSQL